MDTDTHMPVVYIDCDGVLADYVVGVQKLFDPLGYEVDSKWYPESYELHKLLGIPLYEYQHKIINAECFWICLHPLVNGLAFAKELFDRGVIIKIVTSPFPGDPSFYQQRIDWLKKFMPYINETDIIFDRDRCHIAYGTRFAMSKILIDDNYQNIKDWTLVGGQGFLTKASYNEHAFSFDTLLSIILAQRP